MFHTSIVKLLCGAVAMCWLMPAVVVTRTQTLDAREKGSYQVEERIC